MATKGQDLKHREDGRFQGTEKPRWTAATGLTHSSGMLRVCANTIEMKVWYYPRDLFIYLTNTH